MDSNMFCRNCGEQYETEEAVICVKCWTAKGQGTNYCPHCGKPVKPETMVCANCGAALNPMSAHQGKSKLIAGILGIFFGYFGIHNFYLGYTKKAILQLIISIIGLILSCKGIGVFLFFGVEIWGLVEGVLILTGKIKKDAKGNNLIR